MIRFNAPIPAYADLNFLFHRWGYDAQGEDGYSLFSDSLISHFYEDGLNLLLSYSWDDLVYKNEALALDKIFGEYDPEICGYPWIDKPTLIQQGVHFFEGSLEKLRITDLQVSENSTIIIDELESEGRALLLLDRRVADKSLESSRDYEKEDGIDFDSYNRLFRPAFPEYPFNQILIKRDDLKMFEQHLGFFEHGLSKQRLKQFEKTIGKPKKRSINDSLMRINQQRGLSAEELKNTANIYLACMDEHPHYLKTALLDMTAETLEISRTAVIKRLDKISFFENL